MDKIVYLPLASGLLRSYAETFPEIKKQYKFMPFIFKRDTPEKLAALHKDPAFACFSVSLWNFNLSLAVARIIKKKYPDCHIVFGGPSVPEEFPSVFDDPSFPVTFFIKGEGEHAFAELLAGKKLEKPKTLDDYPSPYTSGVFDYLINGKTKYQAIIETNRGCPYSCVYCYWGNGQAEKKFKFFSLEYIKRVAEWIGKNKIEYVFCADSNFGIFERDAKIAQIFADTKAKYGFPDKFRVCYGKTTSDNIFNAAKILHDAGLAKAVTLAMQSLAPDVIKNIERSNISIDDYDHLQKKYSNAGIATYSEIILGLPGETAESFKRGVENTIKYSENNKLFIYHCTVLPNTTMAEKEYREKFGIKTVIVPVSEIHCSPRPEGSIKEYEEIVIGTNTMTTAEWIRAAAWAWEIQLKYSLGYEFHIPEQVKNWFEIIAYLITQGESRGQLLPKFGNIYWEPEEAAYLMLMGRFIPDRKKKQFAKDKILFARKSSKAKEKNGATLHV